MICNFYITIAQESGSDDEELDDEELDDEELDEEEIEDEEVDEGSEDDEQEDDEENVYEDDDSDALSFENDSDSGEKDEKPSTSGKSAKKSSLVKQNGQSAKKPDVVKTKNEKSKTTTNNQNEVKKSSEPGHLLRIKKNETNAADDFKNELNKSDGLATKNGNEEDEYEKHDTDDEEDIRNTVGNIPMQWYDEYKHIGYDWDAKKIIKPAKRDQLDDFLKRMEDPNFWRTVKDPQTGQDVILSDADIDLIKRINSRRVPDADFDDYTVSSIRKCVTFFYFISI